MSGRPKHIVLVNAVFPPDKGASGQALHQLAKELRANGFHISIVSTNKKDTIVEELDFSIIRIKSISNRNTYWQRLYTSFIDSRRLLLKCKTIEADAYILCTDPPFINLLAPSILRNRNYLYWTMDLYPEAFVAKGFLSAQNWIVKYYKYRLRNCKSSMWISLGGMQAKYLKNTYRLDDDKVIILPCGVHNKTQKSSTEPNEKVTFAYAGNLGEAHSADFLKEFITLSDPQRHHFIISFFGQKADKLKGELSDIPNVTFTGWISEEEMLRIDVQIVTLKEKWTHICVPSKAMSAICYHTPIVYHGDKQGDIYQYLEKALWHIPDDEFIYKSIERFYASLQKESLVNKKEQARMVAEELGDIYDLGIQKLTKSLSI